MICAVAVLPNPIATPGGVDDVLLRGAEGARGVKGHFVSTFEQLGLSPTILKGLEKAGFDKLAAFYQARAKGGVGLIVTGGISPNTRGRLAPFGSELSKFWHVNKHKKITAAVHQYPTKICVQLLHAGRYSYHPFSVSSSKVKSPINPFTPSAMSTRQIKNTIKDFYVAELEVFSFSPIVTNPSSTDYLVFSATDLGLDVDYLKDNFSTDSIGLTSSFKEEVGLSKNAYQLEEDAEVKGETNPEHFFRVNGIENYKAGTEALNDYDQTFDKGFIFDSFTIDDYVDTLFAFILDP